MTRILVLFLFFFQISIALPQKQTEFLHNPVKIPLLLAGNFAELRPNHFHMGVDIKTQGKEGLDILAANSGWVSRVKISSFGYGRVLYIDHENETTTVYAHLKALSPRLEEIVRMEQREQQSWEIELFYAKNEIPIDRGELIALSGNTGGSTAPHLHFEVRDSKTEHALNPLLKGLKIPDNRKPEIKSVKLFGAQKDGFLIAGKTKAVNVLKTKEGELKIPNDTIVVPRSFFTEDGGIGIAIDAFDRLDGAENICGLYGSSVYVNGDFVFGHEMNEISFEHTRYINSHRDLSVSGKNIHKLFRNSANPLTIYKMNNLGLIHPKENQYLNIEILGYDEKHNTSCLEFVIKFTDEPYAIDPFVDNSFFYPNEKYEITESNIDFSVPEFTFYEPIKRTKRSKAICGATTTIQKSYAIKWKANADKLTPNRYLAVGTKALKTEFIEGAYQAKTNVLGEVNLRLDTIPPSIKALHKATITNINQLKFEIADWASGLKTYYFFINDEWTMLEYEYKNKTLFSYDNKVLLPNTKIRLEVVDNCNNIAVYEQIINRQNP